MMHGQGEICCPLCVCAPPACSSRRQLKQQITPGNPPSLLLATLQARPARLSHLLHPTARFLARFVWLRLLCQV